MLVLFIMYMLLIAALLIADALIEWRAICDGRIFSVVNCKRITQPLLTLLLLFLVVLIEKVISDTYNVITNGFVVNTAIFIGLIAIIYIIDYALGQYNLRRYNLVELKIKRENYIGNNYNIMKFIGNRTYIKKNAVLTLPSAGSGAADGIEAVELMKALANDSDADEPPAFSVSAEEMRGNVHGNSACREECLIEDSIAVNFAELKKRFAFKKISALILFGVCLIFGIVIQLIGA